MFMNEICSVFVVDDECDICELLVLMFGCMGLCISIVVNFVEVCELLVSNLYDLCIIDMCLLDGNGIELVSEIVQYYLCMLVVMIIVFGSMDLVVEVLKVGVFDFVSKLVDIVVLCGLVKYVLELNNIECFVFGFVVEQGVCLFGDLLVMDVLCIIIGKVVCSQVLVYIFGEFGVGKELVVCIIYVQGVCVVGLFVLVNCGVIFGELMESEFFGYCKGSFSGVYVDKFGLFQVVYGGILFLDEVVELFLQMQVKLLCVIQEKLVCVVGVVNEELVDVCIFLVIYKDLVELVEDGCFCYDLYYCINVIELRVLLLCECCQDLLEFVVLVLVWLVCSYGCLMLLLVLLVLDVLVQYVFFGNVCELENILECVLVLVEEDCIGVDDLCLLQYVLCMFGSVVYVEVVVDLQFGNVVLFLYIEQFECSVIQCVLEENCWNKICIVVQLGIIFCVLCYKLKKLGME